MKLLLFVAALTLTAQTKMPIDQIKGPPGEVRLLALDATGKPITLMLGDGLEIVNGVIRSRVQLVPDGYRIVRSQWRLSREDDGTYLIASGDTIYRNGMLMSPGPDYTISAGRVVPVEQWAATDTVTAVSYRIIPFSAATRITID